MTRIYLCVLLLVGLPVVSLADMGPQVSDQDECYALPESLQTIVEAMDEPGKNVKALGARDKMMPLIPMVQRVNVSLLPVREVALKQIRSRRMDGSTGAFAGLLAFMVPRDGVYRISLGARTWITVLESEREVPRVRPMHRLHRCGGIHKSNEFELKKGNMYWIELSGSEVPTIPLLISPEEGA
jgi:hypothetical protein